MSFHSFIPFKMAQTPRSAPSGGYFLRGNTICSAYPCCLLAASPRTVAPKNHPSAQRGGHAPATAMHVLALPCPSTSVLALPATAMHVLALVLALLALLAASLLPRRAPSLQRTIRPRGVAATPCERDACPSTSVLALPKEPSGRAEWRRRPANAMHVLALRQTNYELASVPSAPNSSSYSSGDSTSV